MRVEVRTPELKIYNELSKQNWVLTHEFIPCDYTTNVKDDYYGKYLCLVERPYKNNLLSNDVNISNPITSNIEMCFWNNLAKKFQDNDNEWVDVIAWSPTPTMITHKITSIDRDSLISKIESGEMELIKHENQSNHLVTDDMWDLIKELSLNHVSLNDSVYLSLEIIDGYEDCMWGKNKLD
jgi:hypothetical protein